MGSQTPPAPLSTIAKAIFRPYTTIGKRDGIVGTVAPHSQRLRPMNNAAVAVQHVIAARNDLWP